MTVAGEVTQHGQAHPYSWLITIVSLRSKESEESHRSEWKTKLLSMFLAVTCQHASGACQSHSRPVLSLCEASRKYAELSPSTPPFLTLQFHMKDLTPTPNLLRIRPILPPLGQSRCSLRLGIFFQSPQGHLGDMGQSDDLVSLLLEVIVDVMDDSTYKLAVFGATSSLGQKVCQIFSSPNVHQQGLTHCN